MSKGNIEAYRVTGNFLKTARMFIKKTKNYMATFI